MSKKTPTPTPKPSPLEDTHERGDHSPIKSGKDLAKMQSGDTAASRLDAADAKVKSGEISTPEQYTAALADTHHTRSEKLRDAERPTSDTFRADAQTETAEAGDDSSIRSSTHPQDDADAKVLLATSGEPTLSDGKDAVAKSNTGTPYDSALSRGGADSPDWHREDVKKQDEVTVGAESPGERNTEAVNALSNAPPYLLSRAETLYMAHYHAMEGEVRVPFPNLRPVERAAWLASAKSTEP